MPLENLLTKAVATKSVVQGNRKVTEKVAPKQKSEAKSPQKGGVKLEMKELFKKGANVIKSEIPSASPTFVYMLMSINSPPSDFNVTRDTLGFCVLVFVC